MGQHTHVQFVMNRSNSRVAKRVSFTVHVLRTLVLRILSSVISGKPSTITLIAGSLDAVYKCVLNKKVLK